MHPAVLSAVPVHRKTVCEELQGGQPDLSFLECGCRYRSTESVSEIKKRSGAWESGMPDSLFCFNNLKTKEEIA